jgi:ParB family chromosome partitioning protein
VQYSPERDLRTFSPASYNPRRIDEASFAALVESIKSHGVIRPVIVSQDNVILAGHQRTRASLAAGVETAPVFQAERPVNAREEISFNMLHNAVDVEDDGAAVSVPPGTGWQTVAPDQVEGVGTVGVTHKKTSMAKLLLRHGPWSNAIATESGRVIVGVLYAAVSAALNYPLLVYYVPDERADAVLTSFNREYGVFSYQHIQRNHWQQASDQPIRKLGYNIFEHGGSHLESTLYVRDILPVVTEETRLLDIGSGRGAYAQALRDRGFQAFDVEFYKRIGNTTRIDHAAVQKQIDRICADVAEHGPYDIVVLDSVINSAASDESARAVLTIVNAFCTMGGWIGLSGKSRDYVERHGAGGKKQKHSINMQSRQFYFDDQGYTAMYDKGGWRFQRFHTLEEVREIAATYIGAESAWLHSPSKKRTREPQLSTPTSFSSALMWQLSGQKGISLPREQIIEAVEFEFDMPYPSGRSVGRVEDVLDAMKKGGIL